MKQLTLTKINQHGVGLLEALIAVALSSIVILGAIYSTGRMLVSQQQNNLQYIVINELRTKLQNATVEQKNAWCTGTSHPTVILPKETESIDIKVTCESMEVTVNNTANSTYNKTITERQPIKFEIESPSLGGKFTVGEALR